MSANKKEMRPFICFVADKTFMINFETHELHIYTDKSDPAENWSKKEPIGATLHSKEWLINRTPELKQFYEDTEKNLPSFSDWINVYPQKDKIVVLDGEEHINPNAD